MSWLDNPIYLVLLCFKHSDVPLFLKQYHHSLVLILLVSIHPEILLRSSYVGYLTGHRFMCQLYRAGSSSLVSVWCLWWEKSIIWRTKDRAPWFAELERWKTRPGVPNRLCSDTWPSNTWKIWQEPAPAPKWISSLASRILWSL